MYASNQPMVVHKHLTAHKTSSFCIQKVDENLLLFFDLIPMGQEFEFYRWFLPEFLNENLNEFPYYNEFLLRAQKGLDIYYLRFSILTEEF